MASGAEGAGEELCHSIGSLRLVYRIDAGGVIEADMPTGVSSANSYPQFPTF
jgi:hypothetical protein